MPTFFFLLTIFFLLSVGLTYLLRLYALKNNIIDTPNSRSSHVTPTPRGGGGCYRYQFPYWYNPFLFSGLSSYFICGRTNRIWRGNSSGWLLG